MAIRLWLFPALLFTLSISPFYAQAQMELNETRPRLNEGSMFTIKLVPKASRLEVYVVGKEVAQAGADKFGLFATIKVGNKTWNVEPKRTGDHYVLEAPAEAKGGSTYDLKLRVRKSGKSEDFEFQDVPTRP